MARGGSRPNSGSKGYGQLSLVRENVEKFSDLWWENIVAMMQGESKEDRRYAMTEFNKLQVKMMPQQVENEHSGEINFKWQDGNSYPIPTEGSTVSST